MGRAIAIQAYRFEVGSDGVTNFVTESWPEVLDTNEIDTLVPVNLQGGQDVRGLPWLYTKITLKQTGTDQELFVMNSVLDIQNKWNA